MVRWLIAASLLLMPVAVKAESATLVGVWKLTALYVESVDTKERRKEWGENPPGYLMITPERFGAFVTAEGRKPPQSDEDRLNNFRTMFVYTGQYRIEADRLITKVDVAWTEALRGREVIRIFKLDGDKLSIESEPERAVNNPQLGMIRRVTEWERSK